LVIKEKIGHSLKRKGEGEDWKCSKNDWSSSS